MKRFLALCICLCLLVACSDDIMAPQEGRMSVGIQPDKPAKASGIIKIGKAENIENWSAAFANAQNKRPHATLGQDIKAGKPISIGKGVSEDRLTLAGPIVVQDTAYTLDGDFTLQATDLKTGQALWHKRLETITGTISKSIGLTRYRQSLYAVAGNGLIIATDFDGKELWRKELKAMLRSAAALDNGRLFVSSINNDLFVLDSQTGKTLWQYSGEMATTNLFGMGTPAVSQSAVVMPTTSGRVNTFDTATGVMLWTENMWTNRTYNPILDIPHITASPVIDGSTVYLVGNAGRMGAYRIKDGMPIFNLNIGGRETPSIAGDTLFLITNQNKLLALNKQRGTQYWETGLTSDEKGTTWYGPIVAGSAVIVASSIGELVFFDAATGQETRREHLKTELAEAPVVAGGRLLVLGTNGKLIIFQ